jgi:hypothetical protein
MRSKAAAIVMLAALATVVAGCGESTPKRAVDARTEVLHFFASDAPAVAMLRPEPVADVVALDRAAGSTPAWVALREMVVAPLRAAGLTPAQLSRLVSTKEEIADVQSSALALGVATPADLAAHDPLLVLATDQSELLADLFHRAVASGRVRPAGELHDASLYRGRGHAYGVRDGVLVSAHGIADVRTAILRRDGDSDLQLDEDVVGSLFNGLRVQGPLLVYANLDDVRKADPGLRALAQQAPWTGTLGPTAATAEPIPGGLHVEAYSKTIGADLNPADLPIGTEPSHFAISPASAASLLQPGPVRSLLAGLAPIVGEATATSDEVRLDVRLGTGLVQPPSR